MPAETPLRDAARVLARALVDEEPGDEEAARFEEAVRLRAPDLPAGRDRALWRLVLRGPGWARVVDAGLAITDPYSPVRHRMCLMLAILEASPRHVRHFLPAPWTWTTPLELVLAGVAGAFRALAGLALVGAHGRWWR